MSDSKIWFYNEFILKINEEMFPWSKLVTDDELIVTFRTLEFHIEVSK